MKQEKIFEKKRLNFFNFLFRKLKKPRIWADITLISLVLSSVMNYLQPSSVGRNWILFSVVAYLISLIWLQYRKARQRWGRR